MNEVQTSAVCKIADLEVKHFKCYEDTSLSSLASFNCIVGPNGCGKSVLGEAIAFTLGGNKRMLRAGSLRALINQKHQGSAQVVLTLAIATHSRFDDLACQGSQGSHHCELLSIKRTISTGGHKSETWIRRHRSHVAPETVPWKLITQEELHSMLLLLGINTQVVDRYIVTQSRQAVAVADPVALVQHLEVLLGNESAASRVTELEKQLDACCVGLAGLQAEQQQLTDRCAELEPGVAKWREYADQHLAHAQRQLEGCRKEAQWSAWKARQTQQQVEACTTELQSATAEHAAAEATAAASKTNHHRAAAGLDKALTQEIACQRKLDKLASRLAQLQGTVTATEKAMSSRAKRSKRLDQQISAATTTVQAAKEADELQTSAVAAAQAKHTKLVGMQQQAVNALRSAENEAALFNKNHKATPELLDAQAKVQALTQDLRSLQDQVKEADEQLQAVAMQQQECEGKKLSACTALEKARTRLTAEQAAVTDMEEKQAEIMSRVQAAEAAVTAAQQDHVEAQVALQIAAARSQELTQAADASSSGVLRKHEEQYATHPNSRQGRHGNKQQPNARQQQHNIANGNHQQYRLDAFDTAAITLWRQSLDGGLPGTVYGWLCSIIRVADVQHAVAVNATLSSFMSLKHMLVVSQRSTALAAVSHFTAQRAGVVTCRVLSELQGHDAEQQQTAERRVANVISSAARLGVDLKPAASLVVAVTDDSAGSPELDSSVQPLISSLLGDWYLVPHRDAAHKLIQASMAQHVQHGTQPVPRINLVTKVGEVFKADGEIVVQPRSRAAGGATGHGSAHCLGRYDVGPVAKDVAMMQKQDPYEDVNATTTDTAVAGNAHDIKGANSKMLHDDLGVGTQRHSTRSMKNAVEQKQKGSRPQSTQQRDEQDAAGHVQLPTAAKEAALELREAEVRCAEAAEKLALLRAALTSATHEQKILTQQLQKLRASITKLHARMAQTEHDLTITNVQTDGELKHLRDERDRLEGLKQQLETQVSSANTKLQHARKAHTTLMSAGLAGNNDNGECMPHLATAASRASQLKDQVQALQQQVKAALASVHQAKLEGKRVEGGVVAATDQLATLKAEKHRFQHEALEDEEKLQVLQRSCAEADWENSEALRNMKEVKGKVQEATRHEVTCRLQHQYHQQALETSKAKVAELTNHLELLISDISDLESRSQQAQHQIKEAEQKLTSSQVQHQYVMKGHAVEEQYGNAAFGEKGSADSAAVTRQERQRQGGETDQHDPPDSIIGHDCNHNHNTQPQPCCTNTKSQAEIHDTRSADASKAQVEVSNHGGSCHSALRLCGDPTAAGEDKPGDVLEEDDQGNAGGDDGQACDQHSKQQRKQGMRPRNARRRVVAMRSDDSCSDQAAGEAGKNDVHRFEHADQAGADTQTHVEDQNMQADRMQTRDKVEVGSANAGHTTTRRHRGRNVLKRRGQVNGTRRPTTRSSHQDKSNNIMEVDGGSDEAEATDDASKPCDVSEPCDASCLSREKQWLSQEAMRLAAVKERLEPNIVEEHRVLIKQVSALDQQVHVEELRQCQLRHNLEEAVQTRYRRVSDMLTTVNNHLAQVYRFLTGQQGDAYLAYTLERRLLFAQGVSLFIRPDINRWRPFMMLSGGQQALASLALAFALQAALPSPFYFFDEVDCALDSLAAARVGEYLARGGDITSSDHADLQRSMHTSCPGQASKDNAHQQHDAVDGDMCAPGKQTTSDSIVIHHPRRAQYIVVSHRPQVFERADALIGVYTVKSGISDAVILHCHSPDHAGM